MSKPNFPIVFNGVDLSLIDGVRITNWTSNNLPNRDLQSYKIARKGRSVLTSAEYVYKEITVDGFIEKNPVGDAEASLLLLKAALQQINGNLQVNQFNTYVVYVCTVYSFDYHWIGNAMNFTIIFNAADPRGREYVATNLFTATITGQSVDTSATFGGSFDAEPYFTLTINSLTGGTGQNITIKNSDTGEGITVNRTWTGGDILNIDSRNRIISVNGGEIDYSGVFPSFFPGVRSVGYVDSLTTRNVTLSAEYYKRYV